MEQGTAPRSDGLENQLRNMLLGNVTFTDGQANLNVHSGYQNPGRGRGRGRGRGNFGGTPMNHADQSTNAVPHRGRGRGYHSNQHSHLPQAHYQGPRSPGVSQYAARGDQNRYGMRGQRGSHYQQMNSPHYARQQASYPPRPPMDYPKEDPVVQVKYMDDVAAKEVPKVEMSNAELEEKEAFRKYLQDILQKAFTKTYSGDIATVSLVGFGSLASGYGMPNSDMDLAVVLGWKDSSKANQVGTDGDIPRLLERAVLDAKMGGRLLTKTRVPILKICQKPSDVLYAALLKERKKWDEFSEADKRPIDLPEAAPPPRPLDTPGGQKRVESVQHTDTVNSEENFPALGAKTAKAKQKARPKSEPKPAPPVQAAKPNEVTSNESNNPVGKGQNTRNERAWNRERSAGPLDFPKTGVGIQCDVNFDNLLGIHNTHMLRCYSLTDPRVRPIVLFVKSWAKKRKINSAYSGTLSSYGWVLMVLHYLVNIAQPPVCPNLQHSVPQPNDVAALEQFFKDTTISGYSVRFWRNEAEITQAAKAGRLSQNTETVGALLRGFFQYFAAVSPGNNAGPRPPSFWWTTQVLSLRTQGGILKKEEDKGWVTATTNITAEKKVTNRYLFAIEDPFEIDHNVARTVTYRGLRTIRDEFRRSWRIIRAIGQGLQPEGGLFDDVFESAPQAEDEEETEKGNMDNLGVGDDGKSTEDAQDEVVTGAA